MGKRAAILAALSHMALVMSSVSSAENVEATKTDSGVVRRQLLPTTTTTTPLFECPTAFGLLQVRSDYHPGTYPMSARSTAYNLDYSLAMKRACYEGVGWLGARTRGDAWGCVGVHYSGQWHDPAANSYIERVKSQLAKRSWE